MTCWRVSSRAASHQYRRFAAPLAALLMLLVADLASPQFAHAIPAMPTTTFSYYITSTSSQDTYNLGCSAGNVDRGRGSAYRETLLDFGEQAPGGDHNEIFDARGTWITKAQVEDQAEQYALGYWSCTGTDTTSTVFLNLGTNNQQASPSSYYGLGQTWGGVVNAVESWVQNSGVSSQVIVEGGNDMELGWNTYGNTRDWANGYSDQTTQLYLDYGDAASCPTGGGRYVNASCANGWSQGNVWYIAYGHADAIVAPEIYCQPSSPLNANQWASISWYGANYHTSEIFYTAVWDENDVDSTTDTPTQAWNQLWNSSNSLGVAVTPSFSMEIRYEDNRVGGSLCA